MTSFGHRASLGIAPILFFLSFFLGHPGSAHAVPWGDLSPSTNGQAQQIVVPSPIQIPSAWRQQQVPPNSGLTPSRFPPVTSPIVTPRTPTAPIAQNRSYQRTAEAVADQGSETRETPWAIGDYISEIRGGAFYHDYGPFSSHKEEGWNVNLEVLFPSPEFLEFIWSPRPHIGTSVNTKGDTSQIYWGLSWEWDFWDHFMAGLSFGGAWHNGVTKEDARLRYRKELGCSVLFRESLKAGYRLTEHQTILFHFDHISNAHLCDSNDGLESIGIQYGYRF